MIIFIIERILLHWFIRNYCGFVGNYGKINNYKNIYNIGTLSSVYTSTKYLKMEQVWKVHFWNMVSLQQQRTNFKTY